jgi:amino acid transporter
MTIFAALVFYIGCALLIVVGNIGYQQDQSSILLLSVFAGIAFILSYILTMIIDSNHQRRNRVYDTLSLPPGRYIRIQHLAEGIYVVRHWLYPNGTRVPLADTIFLVWNPPGYEFLLVRDGNTVVF